MNIIDAEAIGPVYASQFAGVDTVPELAQRNPENLTATLEEANLARNLVRRLPNVEMVSDWVEQAKSLPRVVQY